MKPTDEQAGAWTKAFDSGKFVRKSSKFRDSISNAISDALSIIQIFRPLSSESLTFPEFEKHATGITSKRIISGRIKTSTRSESSPLALSKALTQSDDESTVYS